MHRKEKFLFGRTTVILSEKSKTITGRGRGFWNAEEGRRGERRQAGGEAPGRPLIRGWQPGHCCGLETRAGSHDPQSGGEAEHTPA